MSKHPNGAVGAESRTVPPLASGTATLMTRVWASYVHWRAQQSGSYVKDIQSKLPERALRDLGYSEAEIVEVKKRSAHADSLWA